MPATVPWKVREQTTLNPPSGSPVSQTGVKCYEIRVREGQKGATNGKRKDSYVYLLNIFMGKETVKFICIGQETPLEQRR